MDEPGRLSDEGPRQCPRRVQSDRARVLMSSATGLDSTGIYRGLSHTLCTG
jgi:hypothetical protein